eukprot:CAMPEP_0178732318 /NCGR_PEP_ID=MMETSP0744-20121128/198_1 /TAXON_ID=913974 /ORGANISM="Nitzschia punctata, Strain CCMP561" /LENGTH=162 /DNA_ID=CAMNT_0020384427 /DNA_START=52 /DNA_END=537 /DNA_ORIENTATION=-
MYGGYFSIEFARDVEVQTPQFLTTQENMAEFFEEHYNRNSWILEQFGGRPICIVSAGIHDIYLPQITLGKFLDNVEFWLDLLMTPCGHIVWLQNTAPLRKDETDKSSSYPQTQKKVREWNQGVFERLNETQRLPKDRITVVDVFEASRTQPHADNIHLKPDW